MTETSCLIIFVKNPEAGKVKTRLAASVGQPAALAIYLELTAAIRKTCAPLSMHKVVFYSDYVDKDDAWPNAVFDKRIQQGQTIGDRMSNAIEEILNDGYHNVCLIGSDIPELSAEILETAFATLGEVDIVVGPARDGGYYLIGMKQSSPEIFALKHWSTPHVLKETLQRIRQTGRTVALLQELNDIDTAEDLDDNLRALL